jgi:hypothetical protein
MFFLDEKKLKIQNLHHDFPRPKLELENDTL